MLDPVKTLERLRRAAGSDRFESRAEVVRLEGAAHHLGRRGRFTFEFDATGRFVHRFDGRLSETTGFDGTRGWAVDVTGMPRRLVLGELEGAQLLACALSGQWVAAASPFELTPAGNRGAANVFEVRHRRGRLQAELEVSRSTGHPARLTQGSLGQERWSFSNYLDVDGMKMPGHVVIRTGERTVSSFEASAAGLSSSSEVFKPPSGRPSDAHFAKDAAAELTIHRGKVGHLLTPAKLGDADAGYFVLDTGAGGSTLIDPRLSAGHDVTDLGSMTAGSVLGTARSRLIGGPPLTIGPVTLERPVFVEMDLSFLDGIFDGPVMGVVGYDLFSRAVVELEMAHSVVRLHDPEAYSLASGRWNELIIHNRHPLIPARYENSRRGLFRVDIGAAGGAFANVVFHAPTVERERLLDDRSYEGGQVGAQEVAYGPLLWFELDGHRFDRPVAAFARDHRGPFADEYTSGNVGVAFLEPFRVVFDYAHERYALVPLG